MGCQARGSAPADRAASTSVARAAATWPICSGSINGTRPRRCWKTLAFGFGIKVEARILSRWTAAASSPSINDKRSACSQPRALDGVRHVLGNFVAAHFGIRLVGGSAGSRLKRRDEQVAAGRFAENAGDCDWPWRSIVVLFLRGGCLGPINFPQGRRFHGINGVRTCFHEFGRGIEYHSHRPDGLAI